MIIKVRNDVNSWSYFECDVIHSKYGTIERIRPEEGDVIVLLENKNIKNDVVVSLLNLETKESHLRTILTDRVCYVLNNEGKTIDKI